LNLKIELGILLSAFIILFGNVQSSYGQNSHADLNPYLFNGKKYESNIPNISQGHQYLLSPEYNSNFIFIKGITYKADLNYDIFNQNIVIKYPESNKLISQIQIPKELIDSFFIEEKKFIIKNFFGNIRIYEIVGDNDMYFLTYYYKSKDLDSGFDIKTFNFSKTSKILYLYYKSDFNKYKNSRSFLKILDVDKKKTVKKFIKTNKLKFRNIKTADMERLLNFIKMEIK